MHTRIRFKKKISQKTINEVTKDGVYCMWGNHRAYASQKLFKATVSKWDGMVNVRLFVDPALTFADIKYLTRNHNRLLNNTGKSSETAEDKAREVYQLARELNIDSLPPDNQKIALRKALREGKYPFV